MKRCVGRIRHPFSSLLLCVGREPCYAGNVDHERLVIREGGNSDVDLSRRTLGVADIGTRRKANYVFLTVHSFLVKRHQSFASQVTPCASGYVRRTTGPRASSSEHLILAGFWPSLIINAWIISCEQLLAMLDTGLHEPKPFSET
ncbi:hypothetical protein BJ322DRAFT_301400 [Thelephora terrestris]|uniref:Uncharacterized protein n=1 Tax=Thelephora terrestris TaxID=56493 RepID=A0A9P6L317_9AGAM|nr:hypothetical protein BJ322DRAFT_301400 [Thelephora terrestris]